MYEKIESCPCCNSNDLTSYIICDDHSVSHETFAIMKCKNCSFLLTSPRPNQSTIGKYYQSENYISHTNKGNNLTNIIYKIARTFTLKSKYKLISEHSKKKNILDYGCGAGTFLKFMHDKSWETSGIEPDPTTRNNAIKQQELDIHPDLKSLNERKFSVITLWHVLEHVHNISDVLNDLYKSLSKNGKIIIALPNHNSYDRKHYKEYWAAYDVPRHLYHFTPETIQELMKYHSFKLIDTQPMKLDSYYVSLLSEKYKTGVTNYIKAFINGWLSNKAAQKNKNNYSSMIYIFTKA